jgi:GNAT superfamily N-acetyltransferase
VRDGFAVRKPGEAEFPALARMWHDAWHDGHDGLVPAALIALRNYDRFLRRLPDLGDRIRVAGPDGEPLGLCVIKGDEIDQLFVARAARGSGLAARLLADGEARLRAAGVTLARLARAIRFYEKHGWLRAETATVTIEGPFRLQVLVLTKALAEPGGFRKP